MPWLGAAVLSLFSHQNEANTCKANEKWQKGMKKQYFNHQMWCAAPIRWSKYTKPKFSRSVDENFYKCRIILLICPQFLPHLHQRPHLHVLVLRVLPEQPHQPILLRSFKSTIQKCIQENHERGS